MFPVDIAGQGLRAGSVVIDGQLCRNGTAALDRFVGRPDELIATVDLTEYRIRQMCVSGQLPCFMAGKKYLISEENLYKVVFGEDYAKGGDTE